MPRAGARWRETAPCASAQKRRAVCRASPWQSPVAQQFGIRYVPQFKIFGPDGTLMAEGAAADERVLDWLNFSWLE